MNEPNFHCFDILLPRSRSRPDAVVARISQEIKLETYRLESYFFASWEPALFDLFVVAGAIEYCDVTTHRPTGTWSRNFDVRIAVHDARLWNRSDVLEALTDAANFLTGDAWTFSFVKRPRPEPAVRQSGLSLKRPIEQIMPFSDGLDSWAVAQILAASAGSGLELIRMGPSANRRTSKAARPFAIMPFAVKLSGRRRLESSSRSRGFKFAALTGAAAVLAGANQICVGESGQGIFGPALAVAGQVYPDYRNHPAFLKRMERLLLVLTGTRVHYAFPRIWSTKGESLKEAIALNASADWTQTRSCWKDARSATIDRKLRQCGVCAACLLRRLSVHAAGLSEKDQYVYEDLTAKTLERGHARGLKVSTKAMRQYAIAGVLHLDHLADMAKNSFHAFVLQRGAQEAAEALQESQSTVEARLMDLLRRHREEWMAFLQSLGPHSFISKVASLTS